MPAADKKSGAFFYVYNPEVSNGTSAPSSLARMTVIAAQPFISLHAARPVPRAVVDYTPSQRALMPLLPLVAIQRKVHFLHLLSRSRRVLRTAGMGPFN